MKIVIIGAGAMGSLFGGKLSTENEVHLIDIWKENVDKINKDGILIESAEGRKIYYPQAHTSAEKIGIADIVIIFVKSTETKQAVQSALQVIGEQTIVMSLQNGYGNHLDIEEFVNSNQIVVGTTLQGATMKGAGEIFHAGTGETAIGTRDNQNRFEEMIQTFQRCGLPMNFEKDIFHIIFQKVIINVGINPVTAILRQPNRVVAENPSARNTAEKLITEAVEVLGAAGYKFDAKECIDKTMEVAIATGTNHSSMLQDIEKGRKTEIDKINGAIAKMAKEYQLEVPCNELIVELVHGIENNSFAI